MWYIGYMDTPANKELDLTGMTPVSFVVSEKDWDALQVELARPAVAKPELVKLFATDFSHLFS